MNNNLKNEFPEVLRGKFNWGAFFLGWIWAAYHKYYWPILIFVGVALISFITFIIVIFSTKDLMINAVDQDLNNMTIISSILMIIFLLLPSILLFSYHILLGAKGNKIAWEKREWKDIEHFKSVQKKWMIAGIIIGTISLIIYTIIFFLLATYGVSILNFGLLFHLAAEN